MTGSTLLREVKLPSDLGCAAMCLRRSDCIFHIYDSNFCLIYGKSDVNHNAQEIKYKGKQGKKVIKNHLQDEDN